MSHPNRQYSMPPMGRDPQNPNQQPNNNQQDPYGQFNPQNMGIDYNQQIHGGMQMGGNPNNLPGGSYPPGGHPQQDRNPNNQYSSGPPGHGYQGFSQGNPPQGQPPMQNFPGMPNYRQDGGNVGGQSQMKPGGNPPQDRMQHYGSYHESSAPIGGSGNPPGQYGSNMPDYLKDKNPGSNQQMFRSDSGIQQNYGQMGAQDTRGGMPGMNLGRRDQSNEPNLLGGFISQASNQPHPQMPGQGYNPASNIDPGRMGGGQQNYPIGEEGGSQGGMPQMNITANPSNVSMGAQGKTDPSSMDIGALNRMAEYYATNSDYPKVSCQLV